MSALVDLLSHTDADTMNSAPAADLFRQLAYEKGIAGCARSLLCEQRSDDALSHALEHIVQVNPHYAAFIVQSVSGEDEAIQCRVAATAQHDSQACCGADTPCFEASTVFCDRLLSDGCFSGAVKDMGQLNQGWLSERVEAALLCSPIRVMGSWWGAIGLLRSSSDSDIWQQADHHLLATAAELFSVHLERQKALVEHEENTKLAGALEMAGVVCHKLNQPMQVILGYSSMVTSGDIEDQGQIIDIVKMVEDETRKMGIITKNLMGITRVREAGSSDVVS